MPRRKTVNGVRRHGRRLEACVRVLGRLHRASFPLDYPRRLIQQWREDTRRQYGRDKYLLRGNLAEDGARFLLTRSHLASYNQVRRIVELWVQCLGPNRSRLDVTPTEIAGWLSVWQRQKLAPQTILHRLRVLSSFYTTLGGRAGYNPCVDVPRPRVVPPPLVPLTPEVADAIIAEVTHEHDRLRLRVLQTTGLPPSTLRRLVATDLDYPARTLRVPARRKGAGVAGSILPLTHAGADALAELFDQGADGDFPDTRLAKAWGRAVARLRKRGVKIPTGVRAYDLRHAFAATLLRSGAPMDAVARLLTHSKTSAVTARYAAAAFAEVDRAVVEQLDRVGKRSEIV